MLSSILEETGLEQSAPPEKAAYAFRRTESVSGWMQGLSASRGMQGERSGSSWRTASLTRERVMSQSMMEGQVAYDRHWKLACLVHHLSFALPQRTTEPLSMSEPAVQKQETQRSQQSQWRGVL